MRNTKVSIIIPSKGCQFLEYTLKSLANQNHKPDEIVLILKNCELQKIEKICDELNLKVVLEEQKEGFFTHALNLGKSISTGDLLIFTDDDVLTPQNWIENYIKYFSKYNVASISSRDIYYDLHNNRALKTPDDNIYVKLFRNLLRPIFDPPIPLLYKYRFGSYISKRYKFVFGKGIPSKECFSLPFRGVNMGFRRECIENIKFLEKDDYVRGFRCEQHFGLQLVLKGFES
ncbi:MAG: glycosyltransferase, partial [Candidatus Aenigmarchaeota archaeon]|nr:glycosyltransferase family 2 protein [Candidatus Aenigmarchaeota archaeon]MDW8149570.1 glycosyltransferase [Candidatus Aenigmarchaeota archaeon]